MIAKKTDSLYEEESYSDDEGMTFKLPSFMIAKKADSLFEEDFSADSHAQTAAASAVQSLISAEKEPAIDEGLCKSSRFYCRVGISPDRKL